MTNTTLTLRIPVHLRQKANLKAKRLGIPLALILRNALHDFIQNNAPIVISDPETIDMPKEIQAEADKVMQLLERAVQPKKTRA